MSSVLDDFVRRRGDAADVLDSLATRIQPVSPEGADPLLRAARRAREGRFVVLLLGCFSSGKSTLLNALLGRPVLPVKVNPCTAILTEVVYGEQPSVTVRNHDGSTRDYSIEAFLEESQLRTGGDVAGEEAADRFGGVDRAVVRWPLPLLQNGVVLLDTPGLDDDPSRTARTLSSLPDADAVIFTLSANRFLTDLERRTLKRDLLPLGLTNLFFPTTMVDLLEAISDEPALELQRLTQRARETLGELAEDRFFPLDARGALNARWDRINEVPRLDQAALDTSGLLPFEEELAQFLIQERGRAQLEYLYSTAQRIHLKLQAQAQLDRATAATGLDELLARQAELEPRFAELERIQRRVDRSAAGFIERTQTALWQDLRRTLADAERDLPAAVGEFDLGGLASIDLLTERGRARVDAKLRTELEAWLEQRVQRWQSSLEPKLSAALADLQQELAADAEDFQAHVAGILSDFTGGVELPTPSIAGASDVDPAERWFAVAVGALLLSPGTVAAGWSEGYEGALKGAASRLGVRLAILGLGALLGPVGWAGIVLYIVSDAVLLWLTGGTQLKRLREKLARDLDGKLVDLADQARATVEQRIGESLAPLRTALVRAAADDAAAVRELLESTVRSRQAKLQDAEARDAQWAGVLEDYGSQLAVLGTLCTAG